MKAWMYILKCSDASYYTGSTNNLELRLAQHQSGQGAKHTRKRLPVTLVYAEQFDRIDEAYAREKQVQGWRREKKEALIRGEFERLPELAKTAKQSPTSSERQKSSNDLSPPSTSSGYGEPQTPTTARKLTIACRLSLSKPGLGDVNE